MGCNIGLQSSQLYLLLPRVEIRSYTRLVGDRANSVRGLWAEQVAEPGDGVCTIFH